MAKDEGYENDTGWQLSPEANPMRGFHDYQRRIVFDPCTNHETQVAEVAAIMAPYEANVARSGFHWASKRKLGERTWLLKHGYDSSG